MSQAHLRSALLRSALAIGVVTTLVACGLLPENQDYRSAAAIGTADAYKRFIQKHPTSNLVPDANRRLVVALYREELGMPIAVPQLRSSDKLIKICEAVGHFRDAAQLQRFVKDVSPTLPPHRASQLEALAEIQAYVLAPEHWESLLYLNPGCRVDEVSYTHGMRGLVERVDLSVSRDGPRGPSIAFGFWKAYAPSVIEAPLGASQREFPVIISNPASVVSQIKRALSTGPK